MLITRRHVRIWDNSEVFIHTSAKWIWQQRTQRAIQSNHYYNGCLIYGILHKLMNCHDKTRKTVGFHCWKANKSLHVLLDRNLLICILNTLMVSLYSFVLLPTVPFSLSILWDSCHIFSHCLLFLGKNSLFHLFSTYKTDCHSPADRQCTISSRTVLLKLHSFWATQVESAWLEVCEYLCPSL